MSLNDRRDVSENESNTDQQAILEQLSDLGVQIGKTNSKVDTLIRNEKEMSKRVSDLESVVNSGWLVSTLERMDNRQETIAQTQFDIMAKLGDKVNRSELLTIRHHQERATSTKKVERHKIAAAWISIGIAVGSLTIAVFSILLSR